MSANNFSLFLALRYLLPKRPFLLVITLISVMGVTCAIMLLIVVMSVMTGFERELQRKVIGFEPHVIVTNSEVLGDWPELMKKTAAIKDVKASAPFVQGPVIAEFQNRRLTPKIRGIDPELERNVVDMEPFIISGQYDLDGNKTILGSDLAAMLGATVGDTISVFSPRNIQGVLQELDRMEKQEGGKVDASVLKQMILPTDLEVTGIFRSGRYIYDSDFMLVPLFIGQEIYNLGGGAHGLAIKTSDPYVADHVRDDLHKILEPPSYAETWIDLNKPMFDAIRTERNVMFLILTMVTIVAAFCIMNTQITTTVQKTREIGVMKALGARSGQIVGIFFIQGVIIGIFGTIFGLGAGIFVVSFRNDLKHLLARFGIEVFPARIYQFSEIPAEIVPQDLVIICLSAFILCSLAALVPAWVASRLDPVKALRYE